MSIDKLKEAITRKIGPLPAWGWMLIVGGGIYYYRKKHAAATATTAASTTTATGVPDAGTTLTPGESIVNPDGSLTTAPGGGDSGSSSSDPNAGIEAELQPLITALTNQATGNNGDSSTSTPTPVTIKITATLKKAASTVKKKAKPKKASTQTKKKTTSAVHPSSKTKPRTAAKVRNPLGGRTASKTKGLGANVEVSHKRTTTPTATKGTRLRPTINLLGRTSVMQRPVATHPKATTRPIIQSPPRPSAPAPRAQGRPIAKPAPKPVKKRA